MPFNFEFVCVGHQHAVCCWTWGPSIICWRSLDRQYPRSPVGTKLYHTGAPCSVWYRNPFMNLMTQLCKGGTSRAFWRTQGIMGIIREIPISPGNEQTIRKSKRSRWSLWLSDKFRTLSLQYRKTDMRLFTSHGLVGCVENSSRDGWEGTFG